MTPLYGDTAIPMQVCRSAAGYYIGRLMEDGSPYARDSREYFRTTEEAQAALIRGTFTIRSHP